MSFQLTEFFRSPLHPPVRISHVFGIYSHSFGLIGTSDARIPLFPGSTSISHLLVDSRLKTGN